MNREEAVIVLASYLDDLNEALVAYLPMSNNKRAVLEDRKVSVSLAISALQPWVRSDERRPHKDDGDRNDDVLAKDVFGEARVCNYSTVRSFPNSFPWWMPIPPLPDHIADIGKKE